MRYSALGFMKAVSLSLVLGCFIADQVVAGVLERTKLYQWGITAVSDDETDAFSHCSGVVIDFENNTVLALYITNDFTFSFAVTRPTAWKFETGKRFPISYQIGNSGWFHAEAVAPTANTALVFPENNSASFELFRRGWKLKIRTAGTEFAVPLPNSSEALTATLDCAQRYAQTSSPRGTFNPFIARDPVLTKRPANTAQLQAEAATITANILASSGLAGFRLAGPNSHESGILHAIWWANGVDGSTTIFDTLTVDVVIAKLAAGESEDCKGNFASMKIASNEMAGARLKTVCELPDEMPRIRYANVLKRKKGGVYVFWMSESVHASEQGGDASVLEDVSARLFDAAIQLGE